MRTFIFFVALFLFYGCALNSEYEKPVIKSPVSSKSGAIFLDKNISNATWWKRFNDNNLDILIEEILKNNNELMSASKSVLEAEAKLKSANSAFIPTIAISGSGFSGSTLNTNITSNSQSGNLIKNASQSQTKFSGFNAGFTPNFSANILQNLSNSELASASLEYKQAYKNSVQISIISQSIGAYFMLSGLNKELDLQKELLANTKNLKAIEEGRWQNGKGSFSAVLEYEKNINELKNQISNTKKAVSIIENAIAVLRGKNPENFLQFSSIDMLSVDNKIDSHISSLVLKNRPDILMAEAKLKIANANVNLANSLFFPTISLTGNTGGASIALSNLFSVNTGFWLLNAALSMPILNASSYEEIKAAEHGKYVAYYDYMQSVKNAFADVDNSLIGYENSLTVYNNLLLSQKAEDKIVAIALSKYQNGLKDKSYYLNENNLRLKLLIATNEAKMNSLDAIVTAYSAMSLD